MKERRGNVLDLFLILLLVFSILGVIARYREVGMTVDASTEGELVLRVESTDAALSECLTVGEELYLVSGAYYGELVGIESARARISLLEGGSFFEGEWDENGPREFTLTVKVMGSVKSGVFYHLQREALLVGSTLTLYGERAVIGGKIIAVHLTG